MSDDHYCFDCFLYYDDIGETREEHRLTCQHRGDDSPIFKSNSKSAKKITPRHSGSSGDAINADDDDERYQYGIDELKGMDAVQLASAVGAVAGAAVSSTLGKEELIRMYLDKVYTVPELRAMVRQKTAKKKKADVISQLLDDDVEKGEEAEKKSGAKKKSGDGGGKKKSGGGGKKKSASAKKGAAAAKKKRPSTTGASAAQFAKTLLDSKKSFDGTLSSFAYGSNVNPLFSSVTKVPPTGKTPIKVPSTRAPLTPLEPVALAPSPQNPVGLFSKFHYKQA